MRAPALLSSARQNFSLLAYLDLYEQIYAVSPVAATDADSEGDNRFHRKKTVQALALAEHWATAALLPPHRNRSCTFGEALDNFTAEIKRAVGFYNLLTPRGKNLHSSYDLPRRLASLLRFGKSGLRHDSELYLTRDGVQRLPTPLLEEDTQVRRGWLGVEICEAICALLLKDPPAPPGRADVVSRLSIYPEACPTWPDPAPASAASPVSPPAPLR